MNAFYQLLAASAESRDPYLQALKAFASISPARLVAMSGDLGWQVW